MLLRIFQQAEDAVTGWPLLRQTANQREARAVKARQTAISAQPQVTSLTLHNGIDAILRQSISTAVMTNIIGVMRSNRSFGQLGGMQLQDANE